MSAYLYKSKILYDIEIIKLLIGFRLRWYKLITHSKLVRHKHGVIFILALAAPSLAAVNYFLSQPFIAVMQENSITWLLVLNLLFIFITYVGWTLLQAQGIFPKGSSSYITALPVSKFLHTLTNLIILLLSINILWLPIIIAFSKIIFSAGNITIDLLRLFILVLTILNLQNLTIRFNQKNMILLILITVFFVFNPLVHFYLINLSSDVLIILILCYLPFCNDIQDHSENKTPEVPEGNSLYAMGVRKGENRDFPTPVHGENHSEQSALPMRRIKTRKPWTLYSAEMANKIYKRLTNKSTGYMLLPVYIAIFSKKYKFSFILRCIFCFVIIIAGLKIEFYQYNLTLYITLITTGMCAHIISGLSPALVNERTNYQTLLKSLPCGRYYWPVKDIFILLIILNLLLCTFFIPNLLLFKSDLNLIAMDIFAVSVQLIILYFLQTSSKIFGTFYGIIFTMGYFVLLINMIRSLL